MSIVPKGVFYKFGITHIVNVSETRVTKKWVIFIPLLLLLRGNPTPFSKQKFSKVKTITYKVRNALWLRTFYLQVKLVIDRNPKVNVSLRKFNIIPTIPT